MVKRQKDPTSKVRQTRQVSVPNQQHCWESHSFKRPKKCLTRSSRHNCDEWTGIIREDDYWKAFNDTKYQQHCGKADIQDKGHAIVKQGLLKPQLFPNRAGLQKDAFNLVYI